MTRRNLVIVAAACTALLLAWYLLLWSPKGKELEAASSRRTVAEEQAAQLEVRLARLRAAQDDSPRLVATLDRLRSAVPSSPELGEFLLLADEAAKKAGVDFLSISPSPPAPSTTPGVPTEIALGIEVKGGYFQALEYFDRLLDLPRVVVIEAVQVTPASSNGQAPTLAISVTARMFTSEIPVTAGAAPTTTGATTPAAPTNEVAGAAKSPEADS